MGASSATSPASNIASAEDEHGAFAAALTQHQAVLAQLEAELERAWAELLQVLVPALEGPGGRPGPAPGLPELDGAGWPGAARSAARSWRPRWPRWIAIPTWPARPTCATTSSGGGATSTSCSTSSTRQSTALEAEPDFFPLVEAAFDTADYRPRLWHRAYHRHRRQARRIVRRHGDRLGVDRFGRLYHLYLREKSVQQELLQARAAVVARAGELAGRARRRREI